MRPSAMLLVRVLPRSALRVQSQIIPPPSPQGEILQKPTLMYTLLKQKQTSGASWPANIRLEPVVKKEVFSEVESSTRVKWKKLLKEV
ncbi:hypothetical protein BDQ17DRAFT_1347879 [Cyathus striatus]|nr:hypothetical protein BDQ17DRAFT_1383281 [Cyathus striatus]KAF9010271.1 hypothetical protein BDQ17DRAFT_1347879 [Cyathus striatus]